MSDVAIEAVEPRDAPLAAKSPGFLVAVTWTFAAFSIGLALVTAVWMIFEHLPDNFIWDLLTGYTSGGSR
jgi:hypothetical protein